MFDDHTYRLITIYGGDSIEVRVQKFMKGIEEHPEYKDEFLRNLAHSYFEERMIDEAIETIQQAIECAPQDKDKLSDYYYLLSFFNEGKKDVQASLNALKKSVEADPENSQYRMHLANIYLEVKDFENAVIHYEHVFFHPDEEFTEDKEHPFYTYFNYEKEIDLDKDKAESLLNELMKAADTDTQKACIYCAQSVMYEEKKDLFHALESAKAALDTLPGNFHVINRMGEVYSKLKQKKEAIALYESLPKISDPYVSKSFIMHWYYDKLAKVHIGMNQFDEASELYEKDLATYDSPVDASECLQQLAGIYQHQRQYKKLKPIVMKIIELWPDQYSQAYGSMANYYMVEEEDFENALNYLFKAAQVNYQSDDWVHGNDGKQAAAIYASLGDIYYMEMKDEATAISYYEKVFLCEPDKEVDEHVCTRLYEIYKRNGNEKRAAELKDRRKAHVKFMDLFTEPIELPPPPSLKERLSKPKNTPEEIEKLPYFYLNLPEGHMRQEDKAKMRDGFYDDLMTNPAYKEFFSKFEAYSIREFCWEYAKHKVDLIDSARYYGDPAIDTKEYWLNKHTEDIYYIILQKKLFNLQLLWRAGKIDIPEIQISFDFMVWNDYLLSCPFIEPVTANEISVMKRFLMDDNFSDEVGFLIGWQDYDALTQKNEEDDYDYMPPWYEFYDQQMGTGSLLLLPNLRGEKEKEYQEIYWKWKHKQPPDPIIPVEPPAPVLWHLFARDDNYVAFMEQFENDYLCKLQQARMDNGARPEKPYDIEELRAAVWDIDESDTPVYFDSHIPWHEAMMKAARIVKNTRISEKLDSVWEFHNMEREMNLLPKVDITQDRSYQITRKLYWDRIQKGRELSGEIV